MELRIPADAGSIGVWFGVDLSDLAQGPGDSAIGDVTPERLDQSLAALERGDIEYVGLHEGEAFLQVAGDGAGPYLFEYHPGPGGVPLAVPAGVTFEAVRYGLHAFLAADPAWAQPFPWEPLGDAAPQLEDRKLRRLFRRS